MRKISGQAFGPVILAALICGNAAAKADGNYYQNNTQFGMSLPNTSLPSGADEVRAADGTSCRSAVGGDGSYLDFGMVAAPGNGGTQDSGAVYSRVVVPLGVKPRRVDCSRLYDLEIQRLKMELELARMGTGKGNAAITQSEGNWQNQGWSAEGQNTSSRKKAQPRAMADVPNKGKVVQIAPVSDVPAAPVATESIY